MVEITDLMAELASGTVQSNLRVSTFLFLASSTALQSAQGIASVVNTCAQLLVGSDAKPTSRPAKIPKEINIASIPAFVKFRKKNNFIQ